VGVGVGGWGGLISVFLVVVWGCLMSSRHEHPPIRSTAHSPRFFSQRAPIATAIIAANLGFFTLERQKHQLAHSEQ